MLDIHIPRAVGGTTSAACSDLELHTRSFSAFLFRRSVTRPSYLPHTVHHTPRATFPHLIVATATPTTPRPHTRAALAETLVGFEAWRSVRHTPRACSAAPLACSTRITWASTAARLAPAALAYAYWTRAALNVLRGTQACRFGGLNLDITRLSPPPRRITPLRTGSGTFCAHLCRDFPVCASMTPRTPHLRPILCTAPPPVLYGAGSNVRIPQILLEFPASQALHTRHTYGGNAGHRIRGGST